MRAATAAVITVMVAATAGCLGPGDFRCGSHEQCGPNGFARRTAVAACRWRTRSVGRGGGTRTVPDQSPTPASPPPAPPIPSPRSPWGAPTPAWCAQGDGSSVGPQRRRTARRRQPHRPIASVTVASLTGARAVATGQRHSCAIRGPDRQVVCWGADDSRPARRRRGPDAARPPRGARRERGGGHCGRRRLFLCRARLRNRDVLGRRQRRPARRRSVRAWAASAGYCGRLGRGDHASAFPNTPAPSEATACSSAGARTRKVSSATAPLRTAPSPPPSMGFPTSAPSAPA